MTTKSIILNPNTLTDVPGTEISTLPNHGEGGSALNATAPASKRPSVQIVTSGGASNKVLRFTGLQRFVAAKQTQNRSFTATFVCANPVQDATYIFTGFPSANWFVQGGGLLSYYDGAFPTTGLGSFLPDQTVYTIVGSETNFKFYMNGRPLATHGALPERTYDTLYLGNGENSDGGYKGDFYYYEQCDTALSDAEVLAAYNYIRTIVPPYKLYKNRTAYIAGGNSLMQGSGMQQLNYPFYKAIELAGIATEKQNALGRGIGASQDNQWYEGTDLGSYLIDDFFPANGIRNVFTFWEGTNSIWLGGRNGTDTYQNPKTVMARRKTANLNVINIGMTMLPRGNGREADRTAYNDAMMVGTTPVPDMPYVYNKNSDGFDYVVALHLHPDIGQTGQDGNATYYSNDRIHMVQAGYDIVAGVLAPLYASLYVEVPLVAVMTQPTNQTGTVGGSATFTATFSGATSVKAQKFVNGVWTDLGSAPLNSTTGVATFTKNSLVTWDAGLYRLVGANTQGDEETNTATLTVNPAIVDPTSVKITPQTVTVQGNEAITFTGAVLPSGATQSGYFTTDGGTLDGDGLTRTLNVGSATSQDRKIHVTFTGNGGFTATATVTVSAVTPEPEPGDGGGAAIVGEPVWQAQMISRDWVPVLETQHVVLLLSGQAGPYRMLDNTGYPVQIALVPLAEGAVPRTETVWHEASRQPDGTSRITLGPNTEQGQVPLVAGTRYRVFARVTSGGATALLLAGYLLAR